MNGSFTRRSLLAGVGYTAACGSIASQIISVARAAEDQGEAAICLTMVYPNAPKAKFDARRYASKHLPLLQSIYGDSVERIELRTPRRLVSSARPSGGSNVPSAPVGDPPSAVMAAVSLWIRDLKSFGEKTAAAGQQIATDLEEVVKDSQPIVQYDKVILLLGDARKAVAIDAQVFSTYFPAGPNATFDAKYYGEKVIPMMVSVYGSSAIHRIEVSMGSAGQGGSKPALVASAHFYIRDRAAWDAAGMKAYPQLMAEGPRYTTIMPFVADLEVTATG
jgi:hypothetical protein